MEGSGGLEELRKPEKSIGQDSQSPGQDLNPRPTKIHCYLKYQIYNFTY
jgi:hypothetical protein